MRPAIKVKIKTKELDNVIKNVVSYTDGFLKETTAQKKTIASKIGKASIAEFYRYLDSLSSVNREMLHHVYEWGQVGNPTQRLYELKMNLKANAAEIVSDFLESTSSSDDSEQIFWNKAKIMEEGIPVVINEVQAQALFFEVDGQEFFRAGPIVIENPGGSAVRGQFVAQFEEFYNNYLEAVYLRSIKFYDHFKNPKAYYEGFRTGSKGGGKGTGRMSALKWILSAPE